MKLFTNSLLSFAPTAAGVITSIVTVPLFIALIGPDRYGAFLIALVLLGYFGRADFGLGRAITQRLSSSTGATAEERASIVWSALVGGAFIAVAGAITIAVAVHIFFGYFFEADPAVTAEALRAAWLFALCVPVIIFTGVSVGALAGLERFGMVSFATTTGNLLSQILPLVVAAFYSVDLSWLLGASLLGRFLGLLLTMGSMWSAFLHGQRRVVSRDQLRRLFNYGSWIMVTSIIGPLMIISDRLVIGAAVGAAAVVAYSVPYQIASRTALLPNSVAMALFPRLASQSPEQSLALSRNSLIVVGQLYSFIVVGLICLAEPLLVLWLSDALDPQSILIGQIITIGFWTNAIAYVPFALIQAGGNSRFTAIMHVAELPIYLVLLFGLGLTLGLYGVAIAFALRTTLDCLALLIKARLADRTVFGPLIGPAAVIALALAISPWTGTWLAGIAASVVLCTLLLGVGWLQMPGDIKQVLLARLAAMLAMR